LGSNRRIGRCLRGGLFGVSGGATLRLGDALPQGEPKLPHSGAFARLPHQVLLYGQAMPIAGGLTITPPWYGKMNVAALRESSAPKQLLWLFYALTNDKSAFRSDLDAVNVIESFFQGRNLQFPKRAGDRWNWNLLLSRALVVALNGIAQSGIKKVCNHAKSSFSRYPDIACTIAGQGIGIVDHERLPCGQAGSQQKLLAMARLQHVQADAHVSVKKPLTIESGFSGALHSHED